MELDGHFRQDIIEPALYILQVHGAMESVVATSHIEQEIELSAQPYKYWNKA